VKALEGGRRILRDVLAALPECRNHRTRLAASARPACAAGPELV